MGCMLRKNVRERLHPLTRVCESAIIKETFICVGGQLSNNLRQHSPPPFFAEDGGFCLYDITTIRTFLVRVDICKFLVVIGLEIFWIAVRNNLRAVFLQHKYRTLYWLTQRINSKPLNHWFFSGGSGVISVVATMKEIVNPSLPSPLENHIKAIKGRMRKQGKQVATSCPAIWYAP